jgi:hypothetical protein
MFLLQDDYEIKGDDDISATHEGPKTARTSLSPLFKGYTFILLNFKRQGKLNQSMFYLCSFTPQFVPL